MRPLYGRTRHRVATVPSRRARSGVDVAPSSMVRVIVQRRSSTAARPVGDVERRLALGVRRTRVEGTASQLGGCRRRREPCSSTRSGTTGSSRCSRVATSMACRASAVSISSTGLTAPRPRRPRGVASLVRGAEPALRSRSARQIVRVSHGAIADTRRWRRRCRIRVAAAVTGHRSDSRWSLRDVGLIGGSRAQPMRRSWPGGAASVQARKPVEAASLIASSTAARVQLDLDHTMARIQRERLGAVRPRRPTTGCRVRTRARPRREGEDPEPLEAVAGVAAEPERPAAADAVADSSTERDTDAALEGAAAAAEPTAPDEEEDERRAAMHERRQPPGCRESPPTSPAPLASALAAPSLLPRDACASARRSCTASAGRPRRRRRPARRSSSACACSRSISSASWACSARIEIRLLATEMKPVVDGEHVVARPRACGPRPCPGRAPTAAARGWPGCRCRRRWCGR